MLPSILGFAVVLSIAAGWRIFVPGAEPRLLSSLFDLVNGACGLWGLVVTLMMLSRVEGFGFWRTIVTYFVGTLVLAAGLALMVRTFLFHPFSLPSASMSPTLLPGDRVFAAKYPYGYTRFSLPFSPPLFSGRIFGSEPARGDIVVFRLPKDDSTDYIKRVIGMPGDRIQMKEGLLYINETPVKRERLSDYIGEDPCGSEATARVKRWKETLPNGVTYESLDCVDNGFYDNTNVYTVPPGHFFMMGDNRDNSTDSRFLSEVGYVPFENLVGRAQIIFFSIDEDASFWQIWKWPTDVRWSRILEAVR
jgi:signal peptidase I